ncbi:MAG: hypothetical protein ACR2HX_01485 [Pyrinomonadaceae bacterium]
MKKHDRGEASYGPCERHGQQKLKQLSRERRADSKHEWLPDAYSVL